MTIPVSTWKEILNVLNKHSIPYTTNYESRDVQRAMEYPDVTVTDVRVQINLVVTDIFEDLVVEKERDQ